MATFYTKSKTSNSISSPRKSRNSIPETNEAHELFDFFGSTNFAVIKVNQWESRQARILRLDSQGVHNIRPGKNRGTGAATYTVFEASPSDSLEKGAEPTSPGLQSSVSIAQIGGSARPSRKLNVSERRSLFSISRRNGIVGKITLSIPYNEIQEVGIRNSRTLVLSTTGLTSIFETGLAVEIAHEIAYRCQILDSLELLGGGPFDSKKVREAIQEFLSESREVENKKKQSGGGNSNSISGSGSFLKSEMGNRGSEKSFRNKKRQGTSETTTDIDIQRSIPPSFDFAASSSGTEPGVHEAFLEDSSLREIFDFMSDSEISRSLAPTGPAQILAEPSGLTKERVLSTMSDTEGIPRPSRQSLEPKSVKDEQRGVVYFRRFCRTIPVTLFVFKALRFEISRVLAVTFEKILLSPTLNYSGHFDEQMERLNRIAVKMRKNPKKRRKLAENTIPRLENMSRLLNSIQMDAVRSFQRVFYSFYRFFGLESEMQLESSSDYVLTKTEPKRGSKTMNSKEKLENGESKSEEGVIEINKEGEDDFEELENLKRIKEREEASSIRQRRARMFFNSKIRRMFRAQAEKVLFAGTTETFKTIYGEICRRDQKAFKRAVSDYIRDTPEILSFTYWGVPDSIWTQSKGFLIESDSFEPPSIKINGIHKAGSTIFKAIDAKRGSEMVPDDFIEVYISLVIRTSTEYDWPMNIRFIEAFADNDLFDDVEDFFFTSANAAVSYLISEGKKSIANELKD